MRPVSAPPHFTKEEAGQFRLGWEAAWMGRPRRIKPAREGSNDLFAHRMYRAHEAGYDAYLASKAEGA